MRKLTAVLNSKTKTSQDFAIVYFSDRGFELFASNIYDKKLITNLTYYPTFLGVMQDQNPRGLATTKVAPNLFLFAYVLELNNPNARDKRLHKHTTTVVNFLVNKHIYQKIMMYFDDFEQFLEKFFYPIVFLDDLYAVDFTTIISRFLSIPKKQNGKELILPETPANFSIAVEFNKWLAQEQFENIDSE